MKKALVLVSIVFFFSCVTDESVPIVFDTTPILANDLEGSVYIQDAVFAFAGSNTNNADLTDVFVVVEETATNIKFYRTNVSNVDAQNFYNYNLLDIEPSPFFDDSMQKFTINLSREHWIIITYELDGRTNISSPIRTRNRFQPTVFLEDISINQDNSQNPIFSWNILSEESNAFFFEIMSENQNSILSKTFTNDNNFQYFNLSNVILNLSREMPPNLIIGNDYQFQIYDINPNNWVNTIYTSNFIAE